MTGPPDAATALALLDGALERGKALAEEAFDLATLQAAESTALGRKSPLADVQRALGTFDDRDRPRVGQRVNEVREGLRAAFALRRDTLEADDERRLLAADRVDLTLPGRRPGPGPYTPSRS